MKGKTSNTTWSALWRGVCVGTAIFMAFLIIAMLNSRSGVSVYAAPQAPQAPKAETPPAFATAPVPSGGVYWTEFRLRDGRVLNGEGLQAEMEAHAKAGDIDKWMAEWVKGSAARGRSYVKEFFRPDALVTFSPNSTSTDILLGGCADTVLPSRQAVEWHGSVEGAFCINLECQIVATYEGEGTGTP